ncbi:hypothetical protein ACO2Q9_18590 [Variovorax sp. VNK109]|uniref:hypothetical protein n=1 Tax=Variovorax sp. VNK109 TaxID=3400919 RepID=UPI003C0E2161
MTKPRPHDEFTKQAIDFIGFFSAQNVIDVSQVLADAACSMLGTRLLTKLSTIFVGQV